jgi:hypothetical protein
MPLSMPFPAVSSLILLLLAWPQALLAQQAAAGGDPLVISSEPLPKGLLRQSYRTRLVGGGGIAPLTWELTSGSLPAGLTLAADGALTGTPTETGLFHFTVTVTDSGKPAQQRNKELTLQVVAPLIVEWSRYPKITGQRVEGAIKVSNQTGDDFDLTVILLAVNDLHRATAVGYQHFKLKENTVELEIPFEENLPRGAYVLNVDVVGEVEVSNTIYRARLVTPDKLQVQQGP